jgi:hypothetical protein
MKSAPITDMPHKPAKTDFGGFSLSSCTLAYPKIVNAIAANLTRAPGIPGAFPNQLFQSSVAGHQSALADFGETTKSAPLTVLPP